MDAPLLSTTQPDSQNKKKLYFADISQRRALTLLACIVFKLVIKEEMQGFKSRIPAGFEQN